MWAEGADWHAANMLLSLNVYEAAKRQGTWLLPKAEVEHEAGQTDQVWSGGLEEIG